jgi:AhpD family alkylhydroperoxidase
MPIPIKQFTSAVPDIYAALGAISQATKASGLEASLVELVKIRASQINGCAYCLQFHVNMARKAGVGPAQLDQLSAWRASQLFSDRERAALAWTERLTLQAGHHVAEADRQKAQAAFNEQEFTHLTVAIGHINLWNRVNDGLGVIAPEAMA